jgi:putative spermidine/putrescine transport system permease protein
VAQPVAAAEVSAAGGRPPRGGRRWPPARRGVVPFRANLGIFLLLPTAIVAIQAFASEGRPSLINFREMSQGYILDAFLNSLFLSAVSAVIGAVFGALLAYTVVTGRSEGVLRRTTTSFSGVLAQSGGVTLAFAFIATIGYAGFLTVFLKDHGLDLYANGIWLFQLRGLILVYAYFQIPLMVLVFLPALDGVRVQWREATVTLGGTTWDYWRHVAIPLLTPPFLGATLLLFANAFSAYATAAALITQGGIIVPLQIRTALTSEVLLGRENIGKALALGMIVVVAVVMSLHYLLQRRTARWLR